MLLCNETEKSASSPVISVQSQTRTIPEDYDRDINYDHRENLSKKIWWEVEGGVWEVGEAVWIKTVLSKDDVLLYIPLRELCAQK